MQDNVMGNATTPKNPGAQERGYDDWREERRRWRQERRDVRHNYHFHGLFMGLTLVLLGILFLLNQMGTLTGDAWWQSLLIGVGTICIINGLVHFQNPAFRWASYGKFIFGAGLVLIGTLLMLGFAEWWPIVLLAAGVALLLRSFWRW